MKLLKHTGLSVALLFCLFIAACEANNSLTTSSSSTSAPVVNPVTTPQPLKAGDEIAVFETNFGKPIKLRLFPDVAPKHVANFKRLISEGFYNGLAFHRVIPGLVIQVGNPATKSDDKSTWPTGERAGLPTVPAEFSRIPYQRGTLGAARTQDPNSASSQFFICLRPNEQWTGEYTVFGEVLDGINVADIISNAPTDEGTERPTARAEIKKAYLEKYQPK